jgi:hypothetical protein
MIGAESDKMNITLKITVPDDGRQTFEHLFRNFGEDVFCALRDVCEVSLKEIDESTSSFCVRGIMKKDIQGVSDIIRKIAVKHFFADTLKITEE